MYYVVAALYNIPRLSSELYYLFLKLYLKLNWWSIVIEQMGAPTVPKQKSWMYITENALVPAQGKDKMGQSVEEVSHSSMPSPLGWVLLPRPLTRYTPATLSRIHFHVRALAQFPLLPEMLFPHVLIIGAFLSLRFLLKAHLINDISDHPCQCRSTSPSLYSFWCWS